MNYQFLGDANARKRCAPLTRRRRAGRPIFDGLPASLVIVIGLPASTLRAVLCRPDKRVVMNDLGRWLDGLGLGRHAEAFAKDDIDWEVLAELEEPDLEKLGLSLGHRKKLLKSIVFLALDGEFYYLV